MQAVTYTAFGSPDVLQLKTIEKPTPEADEVLVKVHATALNKADWLMLTGSPFIVRLSTGSVRKPKHPILGSDVAGTVEAVGTGVTRFKPGDAVYGDLSAGSRGGFAEYVAAPAAALAAKPAKISFEQAAAVPMAGVTALQALRDKAQLQAGETVLINGASGGVGMFALQLAKAFGAEVTAVCSTRNLNMARTLGADHTIDYTQENFTRNGRRYDVIIAANGYHPLRDYRRALNPNGRYVMVGGTMRQIFEAMLLGSLFSVRGSAKMLSLAAKPNTNDLAFLSEMLEAGKLMPVIDRCYPLRELPAAMRYLGETHPRGKVVISIAG